MKSWQQNRWIGLLPGLPITGVVIFLRLLGALQPLEWKAFDLGLKWRTAETVDSRITIVALTEADIQTTLDYPVSDQALAKLIQTLQTYEPRAIGIDIFRDRPTGEGDAALATVLASSENVIGISKIDPPTVQPPPALPPNRVGFVDALVDDDGFLRRSLLAQADAEDNYQFSLTIRLAETYLGADGLTLENGVKDPTTMRFGSAEIPRFQPNTGGYTRTDNGGNQTLINFRAGIAPFTQVSYFDVMAGQVDPELLQNRAILIGYTAESVKDFVSSGAITQINPSAVPGITIQAHALSQILSAVYEGRPFIKTLPSFVEYLLILSSGLLGIALARWQQKPTFHLLTIIALSASWLLISYLALIMSLWLPLVPVLTVFLLSTIALYPFYQAQFQLQALITEQDRLIDQTYSTIHNGPLQVIASMLKAWPKDVPTSTEAPAKMRSQLETLNQEMRSIRETLQQEVRSPQQKLVMMNDRQVELHLPLHQVLQQTYSHTVERDRSFFEPITKVLDFNPMADSRLTSREKRALGRFVEEALTNIRKYADSPTRISISCKTTENDNIIQISDNGSPVCPIQPQAPEGEGTRQARKLARQLSGSFERESIEPKGVRCVLRWPIQRAVWQCWQRWYR